MSITVITDSASDLRTSKEQGIIVIPLSVRFGDVEYQDRVNLEPLEFYEKLIESPDLPKTSQPSPSIFIETFREEIEAGNQVIVITLSSKLSGTYQAAMLAREGYEDDIIVIDSENVTVGQHILVRLAMQLRDQGLTLSEIAAELESAKKRVCLIALLDTLEYLKRGGRISAATAVLGTMLSIKPVVTVADGEVVVLGKARGSKNGNNMLRERILADRGIDLSLPVCLGYTGLTDKLLQKYVADNSDLWKDHFNELDTSHVGPAIGTHVGPGAIAVAYFKKAE